MADTGSKKKSPPKTIERAISLIRKAEVKSVPRKKIKDFLRRKELNDEEILRAYRKYFEIENIVEHKFEKRPLGFSVVMDPQGKNAVVSSIQDEELVRDHGLERLSRIIKVNDRWVEHKRHQEIIDYILDRECPIVFSFRKRKHPKRGSLFGRVERPSRSQPASKTGSRSSVMHQKPRMIKGTGARGSTVAGIPLQKAGSKPGTPALFNPSNMEQWNEDELRKEEEAMKAMLATITRDQNLNHETMATDDHLKNLSRRTKNILHLQSTGDFNSVNEDELDAYSKEMISLWRCLDDDSTDGPVVDPELDTDQARMDAHVIEEAKKIQMEARESISEASDAAPKTRARMNSTPVYSTDALVEMHKGTALMKYGKRGSPKFRMFQLSQDNCYLQWFSDKKKMEDSRIAIEDMNMIMKNIKHDARTDDELVRTSFAIVYGDGQKLRLTAKNETESYLWTEGLTKLIEKKDQNEPLGSIKHINLNKQPGLDLHRRQSLASLMEKRTGAAGQDMRLRTQKKMTRELAAVEKNYAKIDSLIKSKKFDSTFAPQENDEEQNTKKEIYKSNILQVVKESGDKIASLKNQLENIQSVDIEELFEAQMNSIKADSWNVSVDLVALKCQIERMLAQPVVL